MNPPPDPEMNYQEPTGNETDPADKPPKTVKLRKMPRNQLLRIIADFDGGLIPGSDDPKVVEFVRKCRLELARRVANLHASVKGRHKRNPAQTPKKKRRKR